MVNEEYNKHYNFKRNDNHFMKRHTLARTQNTHKTHTYTHTPNTQ